MLAVNPFQNNTIQSIPAFLFAKAIECWQEFLTNCMLGYILQMCEIFKNNGMLGDI